MIITQDEAIERIAEQTVKNKERWSESLKQRRNQVVDLYGVEYTRLGDKNAPATFYISISPDMVYLERFEFKLIIQPFMATSGAGTGEATVSVDNTSLSISGGNITPNPHKHTTQSHSHTVTQGVSQIHTSASDFKVHIEGIDVTPYLMAQYGSWINGEGVYPSLKIGEDYDILEAASDMRGEGKIAQAEKLVRPGYKPVSISSASPFQVTLVLYSKYSHLNR